MYCSKCKKQSPDNFDRCAYCGAKLNKGAAKKTVLPKFKDRKHRAVSLKAVAVSLVAAASLIAVLSIAVGIFTSKKPDSLIKTITAATEKCDAKMYFGIYDDEFKAYEKDNVYYSDSALFDGLCKPLFESSDFYKKTCGENFRLTFSVARADYFDSEELSKLNSELSEAYGYKKTCHEAAEIDYTVTAHGENGKYVSVYKNVKCIKLGGKWYKAPETQ
ncbi:MAG: hypothetical protein SOV29_02445 [Oscillospiraceae bacterium]|nr:hypothetical protein [Oscillospiraceae bacterium]